jgi:hypothetical protein
MMHELFTIPILLASLASAVTGQYFLQPKYLIFSAPFVLLLILDAALSLKPILLRRSVMVMGLAIFLIAYAHYSNPKEYGRKENWKGAANFLSEHIDERSGILMLGHKFLLTYYAPELQPAFVDLDSVQYPLGKYSLDSARMRKLLTDKQTLFYPHWDTVQNLKDPENQLTAILDRLAGEHTVYSLNPRLKIYIWKTPPKFTGDSQ